MGLVLVVIALKGVHYAQVLGAEVMAENLDGAILQKSRDLVVRQCLDFLCDLFESTFQTSPQCFVVRLGPQLDAVQVFVC